MNTSNIKKYAPKARREFMGAVANRLNYFGISANKKGELQIVEANLQGSVLQIGGNSFDGKWAEPRRRLVNRSQKLGFNQLVEHVAYTWFNRLCAIRYMELHGYLGHGFRVLSHPDNPKGIEILDHAQDAADELGLDRAWIIELKLAGNKDEELYRALLLGQCHKLHEAMPFLFEALDDETELLLPDNLTRTDSILRSLVESIPDEDWRQVESIGWLYQFYISEKKDEVIGKVVKSEDIPAATQLFTPNWIVKYLVQNSVGRQWLQTYPDSAIKSKMEYYIEPAKQTPEVIEQLKAITPESIEPENIKILDPACGSGHILVEAYNVLKAIYEERGYRSRDIPKLILENNLFGLDIDDRAAQLAGFALMMKARDDDKRIFSRSIKLNVFSLQESEGIDLPRQWKGLNLSGSQQSETSLDLFVDEEQDLSSFNADNRYQLLKRTLTRFTQAKTFGSLIEVPAEEYEELKELYVRLSELVKFGDLMEMSAAKVVLPHVHQALLLAQRYDAIVANPPYMGSKWMNADLKAFAKKSYPNSKLDLFAIFMERAFGLLNEQGLNAQINMHSWMFLSSFEKLREWLIDKKTLISMIHLGSRAFSQISGEVVQTTAWIITNYILKSYRPKFFRLIDGDESKKRENLLARNASFSYFRQNDFLSLPGKTISYWISQGVKDLFAKNISLREVSAPKVGLNTTDNNRFLRLWHEVDFRKVSYTILNREEAIESNKKWFAYNKGGAYRKWFGNQEYVVNWWNDGYDIKSAIAADPIKQVGGRVVNEEYYFKPSISWSLAGAKKFTVRLNDGGLIFDVGGSSIFPSSLEDRLLLGAFLTSNVANYLMGVMNPTFNFQAGNVASLPIIGFSEIKNELLPLAEKLYRIYRTDWNSLESSWEFSRNRVIQIRGDKISTAYEDLLNKESDVVKEAYAAEKELNSLIVRHYRLSPSEVEEVELPNITLFSNPHYRFNDLLSEKELRQRAKSEALIELISYSIGCMMGRYSLDREGLIYAHSNNEGFADFVAQGAYASFSSDEDGIIPQTEQEWFKDDATNRFSEFVRIVWGEKNLQENLNFVAESLCLYAIKPKKSESAMDTIRRYFSNQFYKDHLKTYKKRPIYWLFSSGKQKAFECLVYLHRYNEGTLSRMRTEYVTPLLGKYGAYTEQLKKKIDNAESTAEENRLKKELDALIKMQLELNEFDDKLKHYADMRIAIDLDDGVKINYGKFGDLLSEAKAITGSVQEVD